MATQNTAIKELRHIVHKMRVLVGNHESIARHDLMTLAREVELATDHAELELGRARRAAKAT